MITRFHFESLSSADVTRLATLAVLDVDGPDLIADFGETDPLTVHPIDAIWLQSLAAAHEIHSEATVETAA